MGYDIIGDIHGHADKLTALLRKMGYRHHLGAWRHPERSAIFVGDFIDRGPGQLETIRIVREMLDVGTVCIPTERDRGFRRMMTAESDDVDR